MTFLILGGAGYVGSHMVKQLSRTGHSVVVLDNLSTGVRVLARYSELVEGDLADSQLLQSLFAAHRFDAVLHFAAYSQVGESMQDPGKYYRNNLAGTLALLEAMVCHDVKHFIFSSTAATFGEPDHVPIDELHPQRPINPYGASKLMVENMLRDFHAAYGGGGRLGGDGPDLVGELAANNPGGFQVRMVDHRTTLARWSRRLSTVTAEFSVERVTLPHLRRLLEL